MSIAAVAARDDSAVLPVLDISGDADPVTAASLSTRLDEACRGIGFFAVTGHDVEPWLLNGVLDAARQFFAQPIEVKRRVAIERSDHHRGYAGIEGELLQPGLKADLKETMDFGVERSPDDAELSPLEGPNQWPDLAGFRDTVEQYQAAVLHAAHRVLRLVAAALALDADFFDARLRRPLVGTRLIHYPGVESGLAHQAPPDQLGCGAHSDYGCITLLHTDGTSGLQLRAVNGEWHDVIAPPDSFIVNLGDMLARWTNDRYRATVHRVQSPVGCARYSVPTFVNPSYDSAVDCLPSCLEAGERPKYPPTTSGAYLQSRFAATFAYRR